MKREELDDYYYYEDMVMTPANHLYRVYHADDVDHLLNEKDAEIEDLLRQNRELCQALQAMYSKEEYGKLQKEIESLKAKLESVQATAYADSVDAGMRERRLRKALWVTRTAMAKSEKDRWNAHVDCGNRRNRKDPAFIKTGKLLEVSEWRKLWADNERKCLKKAEEYR